MNRRSIWVTLLYAIVLLTLTTICSELLFKRSNQASGKLPTGSGRAEVAIGFSHGVILASDGSLWSWGESALGWHVLGLGSNTRTQACLRRIGRETNWVNVAVGGATTLALKSDGTIWAWGENIYGQLGDGSKLRQQPLPVHSLPGADWKQVAAAGPHSVALKRDGTLWSWGNNWAGQLGDGTTTNSRIALQVGTSANWIHVWANLIENVGQQSDGSLWFWGWDYTRSAKGSSISVPIRISPDTNWVDVGMGDWMGFAVKSDGTLWAWGRLARAYTGATEPGADSFPARVGTDSDWRACASFANSCPLFMKRDGSIWDLDTSDRRGVAVVTAFVAALVVNNRLNFVADSTTLGGDPAFAVLKTLQITFQLNGVTHVKSFKENSSVSLGGEGEPLRITRALYGNPARFSEVEPPAFQQSSCGSARLRRIPLPADIVAFCGGRHGLGVALTQGGDVWTWGETLGQHTRPFPLLRFASTLVNHFGGRVHWGDPGPVIFKEPARLGVVQEHR
jgi:alpha-tubulin suppressor-like RCC1 family protein